MAIIYETILRYNILATSYLWEFMGAVILYYQGGELGI